ncbi:hypothetical protein C8R44DRAFT_746780 [Mycena epipterygia]|nr:hypothetical protein C8R44DRAFT_746780 [Mycena epipterygia]
MWINSTGFGPSQRGVTPDIYRFAKAIRRNWRKASNCVRNIGSAGITDVVMPKGLPQFAGRIFLLPIHSTAYDSTELTRAYLVRTFNYERQCMLDTEARKKREEELLESAGTIEYCVRPGSLFSSSSSYSYYWVSLSLSGFYLRRRNRLSLLCEPSAIEEDEAKAQSAYVFTDSIPKPSDPFWMKSTMPIPHVTTITQTKMKEALLAEVPNVWRIRGFRHGFWETIPQHPNATSWRKKSLITMNDPFLPVY